jgi:hypothetical protein
LEGFVKRLHGVRAAVCWIIVLSAGALYISAQGIGHPHHTGGVPQDWSSRQLVFTRDGLARHPELLNREPRILHQVMQRWGSELGYFRGADLPSNASAGTIHRDWNFALGGGRLAAEMFPAKYSFDPGAPPSCQNDYVVFALNTQGVTSGQANLVGLHNLYAGAGGSCTGPNEYFAYNTTTVAGGKNATSPVLSTSGTKIAFVETSANAAVFHVLTWGAGQGTMQNAANPGAAMSSLNFVASGSTRSSPWIDYLNDVAYVGADNGRVYKISPVFKPGTPAVITSYPLSTSPTYLLSPPVLDSKLGYLMVGSGNGKLYRVNISTGAVTSITIGGGTVNQGILAPPIVDVTNGTTFVVVADDGTSGAFLVQLDTATLTVLAKAAIGIGAHNAARTAVKLYQPALDNNYYNNPSTGKIRLCGTGTGTDISPWQYAFGFNGTVLNTTPVFKSQILNVTDATCTGWTEFFNPNIPANVGTDYFFFGLLADCGTGSTGCIKERVSDTQIVTFNLNNGPSGVVVDNYSTANPQTSNIYLTNQKAPNRAYKLTQNGLN